MNEQASPYYKNARHYDEVECHSKWVSDDLKDRFKTWDSYNPVMISAQTGSGKNTFILNHLLPYALRTGRSVLLLSNRVALEMQQKSGVVEKLRELGYPIKNYTEEELKETFKSGLITIMSYHSCASQLRNNKMGSNLQNYKYIVFDEAHFFISDSLFNASSYFVLSSIVDNSPASIHIFMTATPDEVSDRIFRIEAEKYCKKRQQNPIFDHLINGYNERLLDGKYLTVYRFPYDFSAYNINFFYNYSELLEKINDEYSDKWLVFVRRKTDGQKLKKQIGAKNCRYLDSTRKSTSNLAWSETTSGIIAKKALICTNVIDNGVSIFESQLKNIVISSIDQTEVFQMIGRKRLSQGERVNLYFYVPSLKEVSQMINHTVTLLKVVNDYLHQPEGFLNRNWNRLTDDVRKFFYVYPNDTLMLNVLVKPKLESQLKFLTEVKADMKLYGLEAYPRRVRAWLKLTDDIDKKVECLEMINKFLQVDYINEDEIDVVYAGIMYWYDQMPAPKIRKGKGRSLASLNQALRNLQLPYRITKRKNKWWVEKQESTQDAE